MTDLSETFIKALPDLTLVVRRDGVIMSSLGGREFGVASAPGALLGKSVGEIWGERIGAELRKLVRSTLKGRVQVERRYQYQNRHFEVRVRPQGVDRVLVVLRELESRASVAAEAAPAEIFGSSDREGCAAFARRLSEAVTDARLHESRVAVAVIHLGELIDFERALGAEIGERLFATTVERLTGLAGARDSSFTQPPPFARIEHDLLAILLEGAIGHDAAGAAAEQIRRTLARGIVVDERRFALRPSVGLALYPADGREPEALIDSARAVALEARRAGEGQAVAFSSETIEVRSLTRADLEQELRWAVEREQFALHYLPIIELGGRRTVSIAALLRWVHPVCGTVAPEKFLRILDAMDLRVRLDRWAFAQMCADLAQLTERGNTRLRVAMRLGRQWAATDSLLADIESRATAAGVAMARLELEVDLRVLAAAGRTREHLRELRKRGARIVMDGIAADGLPLARLASLPIDALKIGGAFIARLEQDPNARALCSSVISVARAFGLRSVAEGVETRAQLDFLYECNCDEAQGPLFCAPRPLADLPEATEAANQVARVITHAAS